MERRVLKIERLSKDLLKWAVNLVVSNLGRYCRSPLMKFSKAKSLKNKNNNYIFCFVGEVPVGFITFRFSRDTTYVFELHVEKEHRSLGIGALLLDECKKQYDKVVRRIVLYVYRENSRGLKFYERNGFRINEGYECSRFYEMILEK
ncbi:putative zinc finger protein [Encephalitozoon romaleae SJ-2008]|uniref:N-alpha-acetyltransferase 40 n=1 Tax=Encephalitozoon romaleae (strain SJ-2008) TaxID=1178016 RepID=I7AS31_ENCRO|nr:putative zinc finger protein [Encephalitozoon romaleae SJ-2008]AFN83187.1 putative zinc finger protein [Encephalitozoon romaleae SJ-2008]